MDDRRMVGCRNCQAAVPLESRFCPRCGGGMTEAARTERDAPVEMPAQRAARLDAEVERAIDRIRPSKTLGGVWPVALLVGGVCAAGGAVVWAWVTLAFGIALLVLDVRIHVHVRARAEREVRGDRDGLRSGWGRR